ncbi:MAG: hypothetical protein LBS29_04335 [Endomicrobium sp.]|nr:hypothetical protein [Endomicrobium sp.]
MAINMENRIREFGYYVNEEVKAAVDSVMHLDRVLDSVPNVMSVKTLQGKFTNSLKDMFIDTFKNVNIDNTKPCYVNNIQVSATQFKILKTLLLVSRSKNETLATTCNKMFVRFLKGIKLEGRLSYYERVLLDCIDTVLYNSRE